MSRPKSSTSYTTRSLPITSYTDREKSIREYFYIMTEDGRLDSAIIIAEENGDPIAYSGGEKGTRYTARVKTS